MLYEYKVIPAPTKGVKAKGVKTPDARFSHGLTDCLNEMASDGWEFMRAETLPSEERSGLRSTTTVYRSVLVFRREISVGAKVQPVASGAQVQSKSMDTPDQISPEG